MDVWTDSLISNNGYGDDVDVTTWPSGGDSDGLIVGVVLLLIVHVRVRVSPRYRKTGSSLGVNDTFRSQNAVQKYSIKV